MNRLTEAPSIPDTLLYQGFVSPNICQQLLDHGLTTQVAYEWVVKAKDKVELVTRFFDEDGYYKDAWQILHGINNHVVLPAFSIKEMEKALPNYTLTSDATGYEVLLDKYFEIQSIRQPRMPDAFALMVIELLDHRVLNVESINNTISQITNKL